MLSILFSTRKVSQDSIKALKKLSASVSQFRENWLVKAPESHCYYKVAVTVQWVHVFVNFLEES